MIDSSIFFEQGYAIVDANDLPSLTCIRDTIVSELQKNIPALSGEADTVLNNFHSQNLTGGALNEFRMKLINEFNSQMDVAQNVFNAFEHDIRSLVGSDIAVQRSVNIVIQQPGDKDVPPSHRDAPPHSPFEVVAWVPLVNCSMTKGMSVLDRQATVTAVNYLKNDDTSGFIKACSELGQPVNIQFGQALLFWTGLIHHIPINIENETRWALNLRYKNAFTPFGTKGLPDYFRILELSPLARLGINDERKKSEVI
jgi:sporadic carbohydrate cluster 2OG-Fe(II) oxygenase